MLVRVLFLHMYPKVSESYVITFKDNIMFGNPRATEAQLKEVIRISCLDSVLEKLKYGIETELKEHGSGLSQGQNQRIAIARALLSEAPILLLDECTSSLDAETEYRLLKNLREYHKKTVLCISHRQEIRFIWLLPD